MQKLKYIFALSLLLLISCRGGTQSKSTSSNININIHSRTIEITLEALQEGISDTLQLGRMRQGEVIAKQIRIINGDSNPLVILREATSCGCTKAEYLRKPIAPGSSCEISLEFDSRGQMGWQMKLMEFYFANSDTPLKIYIDAEVE